MFINVLTIAGVLTAGIGVPQQDPPTAPPSTPVSQSAPPPAPQSQTQQSPPAPVTPDKPVAVAAAPAPPPPLTDSEVRHRLDAIYLFEGVLMNAVKLAAQTTAGEIRRIEPGIVMFSSAPVRAHGTYLEGYGVFFQVEIPSVIPSVASLVEQIARGERARPASPAQPAALAGGSSEAMMDPDAHYVAAVKERVIDAMIRHSNSMELRADEWLTVAARDGSEVPGQVAQPSTMIFRIKGSDLSDFFGGRITIDQARKQVQVRGF
jgi:hypothetical protein